VLTWLQEVYDLNVPLIREVVDAFPRKTIDQQFEGKFATEIDPDAPDRQKKPFHEIDVSNDKLLLAALWQYIRRGQLPEAQELCRKYKQPWRAASLGGDFYYEDKRLRDDMIDDDGDTSGPTGNVVRQVWKRTCQQLCESTADEYERAVYGLFYGNLRAVIGTHCSILDNITFTAQEFVKIGKIICGHIFIRCFIVKLMQY